MTKTPETGNTASTDKRAKPNEDLARRVAERVWELWREDLRRERERAGMRVGR